MGSQAAEKPLYDAASKGDLPTFQQLLQGDPFLLDRVSFAGSRNLLHIATLCGQDAIVEEVLRIHPQLARSLDSQNSTALHIAAAKGYLEITKVLVRIAPEMCWWHDCRGMNPIHIAAVNGHVEILKNLIERAFFPAMEKVGRGQTVLHLCVKHRQLRASEFLVGKLDDAFIDTKDDDGQTLLHLAVGYKNMEMIKFLLKNTKIKAQSVDSMGRTAMNMVKGKPRSTTTSSYSEIKMLLFQSMSFIPRIDTLNRIREATMVVTVLIATMAFQAAVSPPGGVWQDDSSTHKAGESVMASSRPQIYKYFVGANTTAFISSLISIFLLFIGTNIRNHMIMCTVFFSPLVAMASIAVSYGACISVITPNKGTRPLVIVIIIVVVLALSHLYTTIVEYFFTEERANKFIQWMGTRFNKFCQWIRTRLNQRNISSITP